ncbi:MAG TPA: response regulator [Gammaproteobacteria bacterium]|nr:response regulator [Gammaproteobacteria bacterium]
MSTDLKGKRALVVDDFANMRTTLKHMLEAIGITAIDAASNGREAIRRIESGDYDLILCDYNLGEGKDGQQVLEEAKHRGLLRHSTVFVMITAENTMSMVMGAMEYRPDDYLAKPFTKDLLRKRLERQVARKADFEEIEATVARRDYARAIALCDQRIEAGPKNVNEFLKLKGDLCLTTGDLDAAEAVYQRVLEQRRLPWALVGLGRVRYERGELEAARDTFRETIDEHHAFMEAHDWLARTLARLGDTQGAQQVLSEAVAISPKAILRQRELGEIARRNDDAETAEGAYRRAVSLGAESVFRSPNDYAGLAKSQTANGASPLEITKTLNGMRQEFKGEPEANLGAALAESAVYREMGREDEAGKAYREAARLYEDVADRAPAETVLEMARETLALGDPEEGKALMEQLVRNNHDNDDLLRQAQGVFNEVGMADEGERVILASKEEVRKQNNAGVDLVRKGRLDEAVELFDGAVSALPFNATINLNAAQAHLMRMKQTGGDPAGLKRARQYLERVRETDPDNGNLHRLWGVFQQLAGDHA